MFIKEKGEYEQKSMVCAAKRHQGEIMMKKCLILLAIGILAFGMSGCSASGHANEFSMPTDSAQDFKPELDEEQTVLCSIRVTAGDSVLEGILYDNPTAREFAQMLPLTVDLWHPAPDFARAFDLPEQITQKGTPGYEYELGSLAYWDEGPSIALIYKASREETVVPVVPIGKMTSDVSVFEEYGGSIAVEIVEDREEAPASGNRGTENNTDRMGSTEAEEKEGMAEGGEAMFTGDTKVWDVIHDPAFGDYGRLLFPADKSISGSLALKDVGSILTWYSYVNADRTVEIVNYLKEHAAAGKQIFYDIYTEEEKAADPAKEDTGLFFFRGTPGEKFAVANAGGGFVYVAAMHDSFPHALELSKKGYNAFALIYRPGAQTACEDLARAIAFIHEHRLELEVDVSAYSLWGGSAGARMAAWLGSYGTAAFGEADYPKPGAVIMQYTGLSEVTGGEPPTYACVGTNDGIAYYGTMEERIRRIQAQGINAEIEVFEGLPHGFGLGEGTVAEDWFDHAVRFWENNME